MDDLQPLGRAADIEALNRITLRRWIAGGRLKGEPTKVSGRLVMLVSLKAVRKLKGSAYRRPKNKSAR